MTPSTVTQLVLLMLFVVPGVVYQAVRARLAGEAPQNRDALARISRRTRRRRQSTSSRHGNLATLATSSHANLGRSVHGFRATEH
jgi:hypothetical protein